MKKLLILTIALFTFSLNISAKNTDAELNIAQQFYNAGNYTDGYDFLLAGLDNSSKNPLEYRLLGLLAKANGKLFSAKEYFTQSIQYAKNPALKGEMQLELASVEYQLGNGDIAKDYLQMVKRSNPPKKVGDNIDNFLDIINTKGTPKKYSFNASIGFTHDSNVNSATNEDTVLMFGLPFTLSTDAKATSDNGKVIKFGGNYNTGLNDDMSLQSSFALSKTDYNTLDSLDSLSFSLSSGVSYKIDDRTIISVPLVADWVKVGHDNSYYSYSYGLAPQLRYSINRQLSANSNIAVSRKKFQASGKGDSENLSLGGGVQYQINGVSYASGGLSFAKSNADVDSNSSKSNGLNLGYGYKFTNGIQSTIGINYNKSKYKGKEAAYPQIRDDTTLSVNLGASYEFKGYGNLNLSVSRTENNSNLPIYEYDKNQISLSFGKSF